jgi:preprotein translocase subunit SecA
MPQTSDEYYSGEHKYRKILDPALEEITQEALGDTFNMNLIEELLSEFKNKHDTLEAARIPANGEANKYKNVSKNEPCPCGSGKKYKRCHGNDER